MEIRKKGNWDKGKFGKMKISKNGNLEKWKFQKNTNYEKWKVGKMIICKNGNTEIWIFVKMEILENGNSKKKMEISFINFGAFLKEKKIFMGLFNLIMKLQARGGGGQN